VSIVGTIRSARCCTHSSKSRGTNAGSSSAARGTPRRRRGRRSSATSGPWRTRGGGADSRQRDGTHAALTRRPARDEDGDRLAGCHVGIVRACERRLAAETENRPGGVAVG
jgi:hypothetical protein